MRKMRRPVAELGWTMQRKPFSVQTQTREKQPLLPRCRENILHLLALCAAILSERARAGAAVPTSQTRAS